MLRIFTGSAAGGGGAGTVTSVGSSSNSLVNNSAPNPIIANGNVSFEVQIIDITKAAAQVLEAAGAFLEGVTYRITDFDKAIGGSFFFLTQADFIALKSPNGITLSKTGMAYCFGPGHLLESFVVAYDVTADFITELYYPKLNQYAKRVLGGISNNVEAIKWGNNGWLDLTMYEGQLLNVAGNDLLRSSTLIKTTIDFNSKQCGITNCFFDSDTTIVFNTNADIDDVATHSKAQLILSNSIFNGYIGGNSIITVPAGTYLQNFYLGNNITRTIDAANTPNVSNISQDPSLHAPVQIFAAAAIAEQITSCLNNQIFVNIDPTAFAVGYSINLPQFPFDKQIVNIGWNAAAATATGLVTATFAAGITVTLLACQKGQCISYIYDAASGFWYLV